MTNRIHKLLLSGFLVLGLAVIPGSADSGISIRHNGTPVTLLAPPVIEEGRTLIPLRTAFEMVGLDVKWLPESRTAVGYHGEYTITIPVDSQTASVNGESAMLEAPARLIGDRVYVPLRFVSETLGSEVVWDEKTQTVNVYTHHLRTKVYFKEPSLKKAIYSIISKSPTEDLTRGDLIYLVSLDLSNKGITTLSEMEYLENLKSLNLEGNQIRNLNPISKLIKLETLDVSDNLVEDIQPLGPLVKLKDVDLKNNSISSIQTLFRWSTLKKIDLAGNKLDTPEELSPLYYLKESIKCDLNLDGLEEPERNTWNLRSDISPYRLEVQPGVFWVPAVAAGPSWNENEEMTGLVANTPMGKASKIKTIYDLLQYLQHESFSFAYSDKSVKDSVSQRTWIYTKPAFETLKSRTGSPRALANAAAYLLSTDYRDSGILVLIDKNGKETVLNYIRTTRSVREEDEDEEDVTRHYTEYYVFNTLSYVKNASIPAAPEDGTLQSYTAFGGVVSNIHLAEDLNAFVKAYKDNQEIALAYTISYAGDENALYPTSPYPEVAGGSRFLHLPKSPIITDKDDDNYNRNPLESFYTVIYDDPQDKFSFRWSEINSSGPAWNSQE